MNERELENPAADNSVAILDCKIQILDDGSLKQSFYEKQAKKPIFMNYYSAQLTSLKNSCVRSEF